MSNENNSDIAKTTNKFNIVQKRMMMLRELYYRIGPNMTQVDWDIVEIQFEKAISLWREFSSPVPLERKHRIVEELNEILDQTKNLLKEAA